MLVLTRRENESIDITMPNGDRVVVMLITSKSTHTQIGIIAHKDVHILRSEVRAGRNRTLLESHAFIKQKGTASDLEDNRKTN